MSQGRTEARPWSLRSLLLLFAAWSILQLGGLFTPGLLDDVDSIYIEIAREMLQRRDFVTPYINGVRFFDKPPLMYWLAAGSMRLFGPYDWAARIPLALAVLALILAVYALGLRLLREASPASAPDRGAFYAALAIASSIGPYLFTRFYIPDILLALWMTLAIHFFLIALDRLQDSAAQPSSTLLPCLGFAAVTAVDVLTKGLIGLVFPLGFVLVYLLLTRQLPSLRRLHPLASIAVFLVIAAPWHILAALRTPAIALPPGLGLPARGGWSWFYLYNEHIARFLGRRIPHDYGQVPVPLFWLLLIVWLLPWSAFLPGAIRNCVAALRRTSGTGHPSALLRKQETARALLLWAFLVLGFFTLSSRQEYYSLPALPALALLAGGILARADAEEKHPNSPARQSTLRWHLYLLLPLACLISAACAYFAVTAPHPAPGTDIASLIAANPEFYNLSMGHLFDLTGAAMGLFRGPLIAVSIAMLALGPLACLLRRSRRTYAANLTLASAMIVTLLAAHEGLVRFYPILGSKGLALAIRAEQQAHPQADDLIILDGELTSGSTLIFYTRQQVHLLNGRVNGLWYGSFWPDAPHIFETQATLQQLWSSNRRIFLFTPGAPQRQQQLASLGQVRILASSGGKTVLVNH